MAQVSQAIKGNWALLVIAANKINRDRREVKKIDSFHILNIFHCP